MNTKRIIAPGLAILLLLLTFVGCAQKNGSAAPHSPADLKATNSLVLYIMPESERRIQGQIDLYEKLYDIEVEKVIVNGGVEAYVERVMNDLASGSGPDVLFLDYLYMDIVKAALNNNFLDLTDVLAEDPNFSEDNYVAGVFEAGQFDGRQYVIPTSFFPMVFLSAESKLEELGFDWERIKKASEFFEELSRLTPFAEHNTNYSQMLESKNSFWLLFPYSGIRLLDYENAEVLPDEEALREYLQAYKTYFPYDYDEAGTFIMTNYGEEGLLSGEYFFWPATSVAALTRNIDTLEKASYGYELYPLPSEAGEITGIAFGQIAISANSKNSLNAYNFVKMLLSADVQSSPSLYFGYIPIRKESIQTLVYGTYQRDNSHEGETYTFSGYRSTELSSEELDEIVETITGVDRFTQKVSQHVYDILLDTMLPYFQDEASYEDCLSELQNKLTLYLSE